MITLTKIAKQRTKETKSDNLDDNQIKQLGKYEKDEKSDAC